MNMAELLVRCLENEEVRFLFTLPGEGAHPNAAKALLMKERGLEEEQAYKLLRKLSMDTGRPLGAVAADLLAFAGVLKGDAG